MNKKILLYSVLTLTTSSIIHAQTETQEPTTDEKINKIESIINKLPAISGYVNLRYQYSDEKNKYEGFDIRRAYFGLKGNATPNLSYRFLVNFAGSPRILDAYAEYKIVDAFNIQAGQFKTPFSIENPISPLALETTENSQIIENLAGGTGDVISCNGRDLGIQASGKFFKQDNFSILEYKVGVFNGAGINVSENNSTKDIAGTITVNPLKALSFSGTVYNGRAKISSTSSSIVGTKVVTTTTSKNQARNRFGFGVKYEDNTYLLRSEYIKGKDDKTDKVGYYIVGGYYIIPQKLQAIIKYDSYDKDIDVNDNSTDIYTVGLRYHIIKNTVLQLNYMNKQTPATTTVNYAVAQLFISF